MCKSAHSTVMHMRSWQAPVLPDISLALPPLRLYDTARRVVAPLTGGTQVQMYVCGITPYDATHIGHAATYLTFDLINRFLHMQGKDVLYVQNVTDIDDPLLERAARDHIAWQELAEKETELFRHDMQALSVIPPTYYQGAVESIPRVIEAIETLLDQHQAYILSHDTYSDIYFSVDAALNFGSVSGYSEEKMAELFPQRGGDPGRPGKRNPYDALLWRAARPQEPSWPAPFGPGRPGWHIECAAIALEHCSAPIDIQGGGSDLIYPHHEFSVAHSHSLIQCDYFARHYVHTGMVGYEGEKMSKSLGNLVLVSQLLQGGTHPSIIRLALFANPYWHDRMWDKELLDTAQKRCQLWHDAIIIGKGPDPRQLLTIIGQHLSDNLDTPSVLHAIDTWSHDVLTGIGPDPSAGELVRKGINYLLGIVL